MTDTHRNPNKYTEGFTILTIAVIGNLVGFFEILNIIQYSYQKDKTNLPVLLFQGYTIAVTSEIIHFISSYIYFFRFILKRQIRFYNVMTNINLSFAIVSMIARIIAVILCKRDKDGQPDFVDLQTIGILVNIVLCYCVYQWKNNAQDSPHVPTTNDIENNASADDLVSKKNNHGKRNIVAQEDVVAKHENQVKSNIVSTEEVVANDIEKVEEQPLPNEEIPTNDSSTTGQPESSDLNKI